MHRIAGLLCLLGCAATEPQSSEPSPTPTEDTVERETRERLGSEWSSMSDEQRDCHVEAAREGRPAQVGDGTCESLL